MVFHLTVTATTKKSLDDSYKIYMQICTLFFLHPSMQESLTCSLPESWKTLIS